MKSKSEIKMNPNLLTIKETEQILNIMRNAVFEVTINNEKKIKGLLLKTPFENNNFKKSLTVFYERTRTEINFIKSENKSLNIDAIINIDNSRKTYYHKLFAFIEIKSKDKIKGKIIFLC